MADTSNASYLRLVDAIFSIQSEYSGTPVISILWMHPRHPVYRVPLSVIRNPRPWRPMAFGRDWLRLCATAVPGVVRTIQTILRVRRAYRRRAMGRTAEIIIRAWRFPAAQGEDFYFGTLAEDLRARGHSVLTVQADPAATYGYIPERPAAGHSADADPIPDLAFVSWFEPVRIAIRQLIVSVRMILDACTERDEVRRSVLRLAARHVLLTHTLQCALNEAVGAALARIMKPKAVLTLYEGHGWEKVFWRGVKRADKDCVTMGYAHSPLYPHSYSLLRPNPGIDRTCHPDVALCAGTFIRDRIRAGHQRVGTETRVFGSYRHSEPPQTQAPQPHRKTLLVVPEGLRDEASAMFNAALRAARLCPDYRMIFRSHPSLPIDAILPDLIEDPRNVPNITISSNLIEDDLDMASVCLYRGSSAVVPALSRGVLPVHLDIGEEPPVDVLYGLSAWKIKTSSAEGLAEFLKTYAGTGGHPGGALTDALHEDADTSAVRHFLNSFSQPPEPDVIIDCMTSRERADQTA